jgi:hypothetical protein
MRCCSPTHGHGCLCVIRIYVERGRSHSILHSVRCALTRPCVIRIYVERGRSHRILHSAHCALTNTVAMIVYYFCYNIIATTCLISILMVHIIIFSTPQLNVTHTLQFSQLFTRHHLHKMRLKFVQVRHHFHLSYVVNNIITCRCAEVAEGFSMFWMMINSSSFQCVARLYE